MNLKTEPVTEGQLLFLTHHHRWDNINDGLLQRLTTGQVFGLILDASCCQNPQI